MRQQRRDETKGGGRGVRLGDDFMQRAAGEAAIGKARIQRGQPESENPVNICRARQQATQFLHDCSAVARRGNDGGLNPQHVQNYWMFALCSYRTKHELCQGSRSSAMASCHP
jgi:hypothetical protein